MSSDNSLRVMYLADLHEMPSSQSNSQYINIARTAQQDILQHLTTEMDNGNPYDIVVVAGDVFDSPVNLGDPSVLAIGQWLRQLCKKAAKSVILLQGTVSHDTKKSIESICMVADSGKKLTAITNPSSFRVGNHMCFHFLPGYFRSSYTPTIVNAIISKSKKIELATAEDRELARKTAVNMTASQIFYQALDFLGSNAKTAAKMGLHNSLVGHFSTDLVIPEVFETGYEPVVRKEDLLKAGFDSCFLGHIHEPYQFKHPSGCQIYGIGSPIQWGGIINLTTEGLVNLGTQTGNENGFVEMQLKNGVLAVNRHPLKIVMQVKHLVANEQHLEGARFNEKKVVEAAIRHHNLLAGITESQGYKFARVKLQFDSAVNAKSIRLFMSVIQGKTEHVRQSNVVVDDNYEKKQTNSLFAGSDSNDGSLFQSGGEMSDYGRMPLVDKFFFVAQKQNINIEDKEKDAYRSEIRAVNDIYLQQIKIKQGEM